MKRLIPLFTTFLIIVLVACGPSPEEAASQTAAAQTAVAAEWTPTPTATLTPEPTPTVTLSVTPTPTPVPPSLIPITLDSVTQSQGEWIEKLASQSRFLFSPDGQFFLGDVPDIPYGLYDIEAFLTKDDNSQTLRFPGYKAAVSPDNQLFAIYDTDREPGGWKPTRSYIQLWDMNTETMIKEWDMLEPGFYDSPLAFSADSTYLVAVEGWNSPTQTARNVWTLDIESQKETTFVFPSTDHVAYNPYQNHLASPTQVIDATTGEMVADLSPYTGRAIMYSLDGSLMVLSDIFSKFWIFETTDYTLLTTLENVSLWDGMALSLDNQYFVHGELHTTTEGDDEITQLVVDFRALSTPEDFVNILAHPAYENEEGRFTTSYTTSRMAFSTDGSLLFTGGDDGLLKVWDVSTLDEDAEPLLILAEYDKPILRLLVSPDGKTLAARLEIGEVVHEGGSYPQYGWYIFGLLCAGCEQG